jgi:hypothetical protein
MLAHSKFGASKFEQLMLCAGSIVLGADAPRRTSQYSAEGTAAHQLLTWALEQGKAAADFLGTSIEADGFTFIVDDEMAEHVQVTIDYVRDVAGDDGFVLVDQRVNYARYLGVSDDLAWGTLDVAVLKGDELIVIDLKYGRGVEVSAERNPQLSLYALGILSTLRDMGDLA